MNPVYFSAASVIVDGSVYNSRQKKPTSASAYVRKVEKARDSFQERLKALPEGVTLAYRTLNYENPLLGYVDYLAIGFNMTGGRYFTKTLYRRNILGYPVESVETFVGRALLKVEKAAREAGFNRIVPGRLPELAEV